MGVLWPQFVLGGAAPSVVLADLGRPGTVVATVEADTAVTTLQAARVMCVGTTTGLVKVYDGHLRSPKPVHMYRAHPGMVTQMAMKQDTVVTCGGSSQFVRGHHR
mgnify:FL=1